MQVYIGIDWSEKKHDVVFLNELGATISQIVIEHTLAGFQKFDDTCQRIGLQAEEIIVGLETAHNLLIDHLWSRGFTQVYVIPPSVVKSCQGRYGSSGSINDPKSAQLIADILRTDRHRLRPWHPDSLLTRQMRAKVSLIIHLTRQTTRLSNRLRAVLLRYYPTALQVFNGGLGSQITLAFIQAYPNPQAVQDLSFQDFQHFAQQHAYPLKNVAACFARLQVPPPPTPLETQLIFQPEALLLAQLLLQTLQDDLHLHRELLQLFKQHPDFATFNSLPGTGDFLAPALCAKFGDDRLRFPDASSAQALAGTCPATKSSGKGRWVYFRRACDREWRYIAQLWAKSLLLKDESSLATSYFESVRSRNPSTNHAYRCLANRWLTIAWKLWQSHATYDEAYHVQQLAARRKPRS